MKYPLASDWLARGLLLFMMRIFLSNFFLYRHRCFSLLYNFYKETRRMKLLVSNEIQQLRDVCVKLMGWTYLCIVKQKWFEKISSPHVRWIKDVYSQSISV